MYAAFTLLGERWGKDWVKNRGYKDYFIKLNIEFCGSWFKDIRSFIKIQKIFEESIRIFKLKKHKMKLFKKHKNHSNLCQQNQSTTSTMQWGCVAIWTMVSRGRREWQRISVNTFLPSVQKANNWTMLMWKVSAELRSSGPIWALILSMKFWMEVGSLKNWTISPSLSINFWMGKGYIDGWMNGLIDYIVYKTKLVQLFKKKLTHPSHHHILSFPVIHIRLLL